MVIVLTLVIRVTIIFIFGYNITAFITCTPKAPNLISAF